MLLRNLMYNYLFKTGASLFCFTLTLASLCNIADAQSEEEMQILRMYYKEKDLVVISPTRHPKPVSQAAENMTVVTKEEIEAMNAHTVAEVLNRVTGVFIDFNGQDFGSGSVLSIQGSDEWHVLVLVDGIPWNFLSSGNAETNSIPVGIIERIEVIKGPASSAWGSSLGGVVNIITKSAGTTTRPSGTISGSYGERNTQDYRAEIAGKAGPVGYYLFAGSQDSDGLRDSRYFDNDSVYGRFTIPIVKNVNVGLSAGYSEPHIRFGDILSQDITTTGISRTFFATASLDAVLFKEISLNLTFHTFKQKFIQENDELGSDVLYLDSIYDEKTTSGSGKLVWRNGVHTAVLGADFDRGKLEQTIDAGTDLQLLGAPPTSKTDPDIKKWAVYFNDTMVIDRLSITPGIRYDYNDITGSFTSPSLGLTYQLAESSVLRASVARGFTVPPLSWTSGGALFLDPNPDLEPERVWSYQAGVESTAFPYLWVKTTLFHHDLKNALIREPSAGGPPANNDLYINQGEIRRQGFELEAETMPIYNISLLAGLAYVRIKPSEEPDATENYTYNIGIKYDDKESWRTEIFGHYVWWDLDSSWGAEAHYDDFIWDFNLNKKLFAAEKIAAEFFFTAHNLFNSSQYSFTDYKNPQRWVEGGIRINF